MSLDKVRDVVFWVTNMLSIYSIHIMFSSLLEVKSKYVRRIIFPYLFFYLLNSVSYLVGSSPLYTMLLFASCLFLTAAFFYEGTLAQKGVCVCLVWAVLFGVEFLSGYLVAAVSGKMLNDILEIPYETLCIMVVASLLEFLTAVSMHLKFRVKEKAGYTPSYWYMILIVPVSSIFLVFLIFQNGEPASMEVHNAAMTICICLLLVMNIGLVFLMEKNMKEQREQQETEILYEKNRAYRENIEIQQNYIRNMEGYRHDIKNYYLSIKALIQEGQYELAEKRLDDELAFVHEIRMLVHTGCTEIDVLLNHKLAYAASLDIKVDTEIGVHEIRGITERDLCIVISNLFDNAIEACSCAETEKIIFYRMRYDRGFLYIEMENPYSGKLMRRGKHYCTTKPDAAGHGYGLRNIEKIVDMYDGCLQISTEEQKFMVQVLFGVEG